MQTKETERGLILSLNDDVLFESNESSLKPGSLRRLLPIISFLKNFPTRTITIEGHTDTTGSHSLNQDLSQRRADAVRALFVEQGISSNQITSVGLAERFPVASNSHASGRLQNRRVEIIISQSRI